MCVCVCVCVFCWNLTNFLFFWRLSWKITKVAGSSFQNVLFLDLDPFKNVLLGFKINVVLESVWDLCFLKSQKVLKFLCFFKMKRKICEVHLYALFTVARKIVVGGLLIHSEVYRYQWKVCECDIQSDSVDFTVKFTEFSGSFVIQWISLWSLQKFGESKTYFSIPGAIPITGFCIYYNKQSITSKVLHACSTVTLHLFMILSKKRNKYVDAEWIKK